MPAGPTGSVGLTSVTAVQISDVSTYSPCINLTKATGSDGVPGIVFSRRSVTLGPYVTRIINRTRFGRTVLVSFKQSHVSPLFKGGDATSARNYTLVSLLPIVSRILELNY